MSEREACPVCAVVHPGTCRNQRGQKVWPPHALRAAAGTPTRDTTEEDK